eukprot:m.118527 g.118527  ORF g.118527 m.118527 type:complete len:269 (+) comp19511_c0_seq2:66-872(+)
MRQASKSVVLAGAALAAAVAYVCCPVVVQSAVRVGLTLCASVLVLILIERSLDQLVENEVLSKRWTSYVFKFFAVPMNLVIIMSFGTLFSLLLTLCFVLVLALFARVAWTPRRNDFGVDLRLSLPDREYGLSALPAGASAGARLFTRCRRVPVDNKEQCRQCTGSRTCTACSQLKRPSGGHVRFRSLSGTEYDSVIHSDVCSICLSPLLRSCSEKVHALECGHLYHPSCLELWLENSHQCPVCRCRLTVQGKVLVSAQGGCAQQQKTM